MEVFCHLISDLNRHLNMSLVLHTDGRTLTLMSMNFGIILVEMNASQTLDFFKKLTELKRLITSFFNHYCLNEKISAAKVQQTIFLHYNFDIEKHYKLQKNGNY